MSALEGALTLARLLDSLRVPYMVIGGLANAVWGEPRATLDIDVTVWVPDSELPDTVRRLKIVSERERDLADARGIVLRRLPELDRGYLDPRIAELARLLERPEIGERWEAWKQEAKGS